MRRRVFLPCILALALLFVTSLITSVSARAMSPLTQRITISAVAWAPASPPPLLPGETLWRGVPSYAFGTNETQEWDGDFTFETLPALQQAVKAAHFTLLRTWFFELSLADGHAVTDSEQLGRVQALRNAGMTCLAELPTANSLAYDEHLVSLLKGQCALYEFMNEPDDEQVTSSAYLSQWNAEIPKLRALDPNARFGGPASAGPSYTECTYYDDGTQECFMQKVLKGMAQSGILPDFVTFHWYPCFEMDATTCLAQTNTFGEQVTLVRGWLTHYFGAAGGAMPLGVTEWNVDPSAPMPSYTQDATWMTAFTVNAEKSMVRAGVSFANQFDLASAAGYGSDDMVDIYHNGAPKPQWNALVGLINEAYTGAPPYAPPAPTPTPTPTPNRAPTPTPSPAHASTVTRTVTAPPFSNSLPPGSGNAEPTPAPQNGTAGAAISSVNGSGDPLTILGLIGMAMALLGGVLFLVRKKPAL